MVSCFICVQPVDNYPSNRRSQSFKELLIATCQLLEFGDVSGDGWAFPGTSCEKVCCTRCYNLLQTIKHLHESLKEIQWRLKQCLESLETTVHKSAKVRDKNVSNWSQGLFKFRNKISIRRKKSLTGQNQKMMYLLVDKLKRIVFPGNKKLAGAKETLKLNYDEELIEVPLADDDNCCEDPLELERPQEDEVSDKPEWIAELSKKLFTIKVDVQNHAVVDRRNREDAADIVITGRVRRKRKIVVIAEEDESVSEVRDADTFCDESMSQNEDVVKEQHKSRSLHELEIKHVAKDKKAGRKKRSKEIIQVGRQSQPRLRQRTRIYKGKKISDDDTDSEDFASDSSSSWKHVTKKPKLKKKKKANLQEESLIEGAGDFGVFIPGVSPGKWFTCAINGCKSGWSYKEDWSRHLRRKHPGVDRKTAWKEMRTREFAPRRLLHCGHPKCPKFDNRQQWNAHMRTLHPESCKPRPPAEPPANVWACDMCKELVPKTDIAPHVRDHVGDYAIKCPNPDCIYTFSTIKYYKDHMRNKIHKKTGCSQYFEKGPNFEVCELCGYRPAPSQGVRRHMEVVHETGSSKPFSCPVKGCSEVFTHRQTVWFHISYRHAALKKKHLVAAPNSQFCPECSKCFPHERIAAHFTDAHKVPAEFIVSCQHCPFKAPSKEQLIDHFLVHFRGGISLACDICTEEPVQRYSRLGDLRRHYLENHQIGKAFICEFCSKAFTRKDTLDSHISNMHSGNPKLKMPRNFTCDICVEETPVKYTQAELARHKILEHGAEPYKCPSCPQTFTSWAMLCGHKRIHAKVIRKTYPCPIPGCKTVVMSPADLERHKKTVMHLGRTNAFVCEECGAGFNTFKSRRIHQKSVHSTEKRFVCETCGRGFKSGVLLKYHVRLHTGERPFACSICENRYTIREHLKRHMRTNHPNVFYNKGNHHDGPNAEID